MFLVFFENSAVHLDDIVASSPSFSALRKGRKSFSNLFVQHHVLCERSAPLHSSVFLGTFSLSFLCFCLLCLAVCCCCRFCCCRRVFQAFSLLLFHFGRFYFGAVITSSLQTLFSNFCSVLCLVLSVSPNFIFEPELSLYHHRQEELCVEFSLPLSVCTTLLPSLYSKSSVSSVTSGHHQLAPESSWFEEEDPITITTTTSTTTTTTTTTATTVRASIFVVCRRQTLSISLSLSIFLSFEFHDQACLVVVCLLLLSLSRAHFLSISLLLQSLIPCVCVCVCLYRRLRRRHHRRLLSSSGFHYGSLPVLFTSARFGLVCSLCFSLASLPRPTHSTRTNSFASPTFSFSGTSATFLNLNTHQSARKKNGLFFSSCTAQIVFCCWLLQLNSFG